MQNPVMEWLNNFQVSAMVKLPDPRLVLKEQDSGTRFYYFGGIKK